MIRPAGSLGSVVVEPCFPFDGNEHGVPTAGYEIMFDRTAVNKRC